MKLVHFGVISTKEYGLRCGDSNWLYLPARIFEPIFETTKCIAMEWKPTLSKSFK